MTEKQRNDHKTETNMNTTLLQLQLQLNFISMNVNYTCVSQIDIPLLLLFWTFLVQELLLALHVNSVQRQRRSSWRFPNSVRQPEEHSATEVFLALHFPQIVTRRSAHTAYY